MITQILIIFYYCICLNDPGAEIMEGCCMDLLSLKEFLDLFAHVPCSFFGEGEREELEGSMPSFSTIYAIFAVIVVVLPVPAPARIIFGAWVVLYGYG
ncbi:MAG: hypothetical protein OIN83_12770 [Candidatus Methanoperedens sp.]|nr:hypothetical protein [Candidatus Methanoperedens sp.]